MLGIFLKRTFRNLLTFLVFGVVLGVWGSQEVYADIYMYIDNQGVLHFTNRPTSSNYKVYVKENPLKSLPQMDSDQYDNIIQEAADLYGVSFSLIKAVIRAESGFNPKAVSHKGAMGLMQIMPDNFKEFNLQDPLDPKDNIMAGVRYIAHLLDRFQGKLPLALAAYNAGPNRVEAYQDIPPIAETEEYVKRVMKYYYAYN
ncbi:MAG: transglycosylase SLT domain-containing protein [Desulfobacteraceae bacterium]